MAYVIEQNVEVMLDDFPELREMIDDYSDLTDVIDYSTNDRIIKLGMILNNVERVVDSLNILLYDNAVSNCPQVSWILTKDFTNKAVIRYHDGEKVVSRKSATLLIDLKAVLEVDVRLNIYERQEFDSLIYIFDRMFDEYLYLKEGKV